MLIVTLLFQAPGSNPTVPSTTVEPHRSYSSLVTAQTSAWLSWTPEFPRVQPTLAAAALIAGELAACFCSALPSSLLPPYPVPSTSYLFSWILPPVGAGWPRVPPRCCWSPGSPAHSSPPAPELPWPATTAFCFKTSAVSRQSWMVHKQTEEGSDSILGHKSP